MIDAGTAIDWRLATGIEWISNLALAHALPLSQGICAKQVFAIQPVPRAQVLVQCLHREVASMERKYETKGDSRNQRSRLNRLLSEKMTSPQSTPVKFTHSAEQL